MTKKTYKSFRTIVALFLCLMMVFGFAVSAFAAPETDAEVTQLSAPVLREYFRIISGVNPSPHLAWDAVEGAVDYMVYAFDIDPEEYPDAEPVKARLASAPVAPDITTRGGMGGAEAMPGLRPKLPVDFEFDPQNPVINVMTNFFTGSIYVTHPDYSPTDPLPPGEYWFAVRALAENPEYNSELSNVVGTYTSFFIDAAHALEIMGDGVPGEDFLLIDMRGFSYSPGVGPVANLEFEQQGRLRGALEGYRLDVMPPSAFPDELMEFDRDLPVFVICLGGLRSRNAALSLAGLPHLAAEATGRTYADFEDFVPFSRVYDIGGINQWPYGRILAAPTGPIAGGIPNPSPRPTIADGILTWGALPDFVSYSVFVFTDAETIDPDEAVAYVEGIRGNGFRFPAGVSPQPTSEAVTLRLADFDLPDGAYFIRIQGVVDPTINGVETWGKDSPLGDALRFHVGAAEATRAMFTQAFADFEDADLEAFAGVEPSFGDVAADSEYFAAIEWAAERSIVLGIGSGSFAPDTLITREQVAVIIHRYLQDLNFDFSVLDEIAVPTDDDDISSWAVSAVYDILALEIMAVQTGDRFNPQATLTMAEIGFIFDRLLEVIA